MKKFIALNILLLAIFISSASTVFAYSNRVPLIGTTIADKSLQKKTLMAAYLAVGTAMPTSCKKMSVLDTKVTKEPYDLEYQDEKKIAGKWEEIWTINACQQEYDVPIEFIIDKTGTSYIIYPKNVISK